MRSDAIARIRGYGSVLVAVSGGVDSAVLVALAVEALGSAKVLAATADSDSVPERDLGDARAVASRLGVEHVAVRTGEMALAAYRANRGDRCFHCRGELFRVLAGLARERGLARMAYGAIVDDLGDVRPGMEAARQWGVRAPLLEAGFGKVEVRALAAELDLPVARKPAAACLASRIPEGTEVTPSRLAQVGRAEEALRALGFGQLRVRHHGDLARVELDPAEMFRLGDPTLRRRIGEAVRAAGFRDCSIDVDGYGAGRRRPAESGAEGAGTPARPAGQ